MEKDALISKLYCLIRKADDKQAIEEIDPKLEEETEKIELKTDLQHKILDSLSFFEAEMQKAIGGEQEIQSFLKGYQRMALLSKSYSNADMASLYDVAKDINIFKGFGIKEPIDVDRLEQVIYIDTVAHNLHQIKQDNGVSLYKQLDDLADISKSAGEKWREDRFIGNEKGGIKIDKKDRR